MMTASVQVFSRRRRKTFHALMRPAAEKRQCTKSRREVVRWRCRGLWGLYEHCEHAKLARRTRVLKIKRRLVCEDCDFLFGRKDTSTDVIKALLAAHKHHQRAGRPNGFVNGEVYLVGASVYWALGTDRRVHHHDLRRLQSESPEVFY
jgi:hypothetical protein